jgi:hypothetical protein
MVKQIYQEKDLPMADLERIGLAKNGVLALDQDDLKAMLSGRRTDMLRLENLATDGLHIPALDAKISLKQNKAGKLELMVHPIYREPAVPKFLTAKHAGQLERGDIASIEHSLFNEDGKLKEVLVEFDRDTNEYIVTDTSKIVEPEAINGNPLTAEQKARYRKGKEVQMPDGTTIQFSGTNAKAIRSDKLALIASVLIDGGITYVLYKGLSALFNKKHTEKSGKYSEDYKKAFTGFSKQEYSKNVKAEPEEEVVADQSFSR